MKKLLIALTVCCVLFLSACDGGLAVVNLKISRYPDTIVYIQGASTAPRLMGGKVLFITRSGGTEVVPMISDYVQCTHDIDFNKPGVYTVTLSIEAGVSQSFPVQVVSQEWLKENAK